MAYAAIEDVTARTSRSLSSAEEAVCINLLDDAAVIIDAYAPDASEDIKKVVSVRMVMRAIDAGGLMGVPAGATQGSMSGLGYSQSWTIGSGGGTGELYLGKTEKSLLGMGNRIGSHSPVEDMTCEAQL